jgi:hypothetical protein
MSASARRFRALDLERQLRFHQLARELGGLAPPVGLSLNGNRRTFISLRGGGRQPLVLSLHPAILDHERACDELPRWASRSGRGCGDGMRAALDAIGDAERARERHQAPIALEPLGGPLDLALTFAEVHGRHFPHLPRPSVAWSPGGLRGRRRHLRFASYRARPPRVLVSRRLDQPWVAREFVRYVLYHELCHHAQACDPVRGERPHSARFRRWEVAYPDSDLLRRWERQQLDRFLAGAPAGSDARAAGTEGLATLRGSV